MLMQGEAGEHESEGGAGRIRGYQMLVSVSLPPVSNRFVLFFQCQH